MRLTLSFLNIYRLSQKLVSSKINVTNSCYLLQKNSHKLNYNQLRCFVGKSPGFLEVPDDVRFSVFKRLKHKKNKSSKLDDDDSDEEKDDIDPVLQTMVESSKNANIVSVVVSSLRTDAVVKVGMGISRNKAEIALYESKIRINGQKVLKKGQTVRINDEVDLIHGPSPKNPKFIVVTRLTILNAESIEDGYRIKALKDKNLTIENYDDPYQAADTSGT